MVSTAIQMLDDADLMVGAVNVAVEWSTVSFKDGLALAGKGVIQNFPLIPGSDLAGTWTGRYMAPPRYFASERRAAAQADDQERVLEWPLSPKACHCCWATIAPDREVSAVHGQRAAHYRCPYRPFCQHQQQRGQQS